MWFPIEIFAQIKAYMLDYKKTFSLNILPLIYLEKAIDINTIGPVFNASSISNRYIYKINYKVPRYSHKNMSESRLNKLESRIYLLFSFFYAIYIKNIRYGILRFI